MKALRESRGPLLAAVLVAVCVAQGPTWPTLAILGIYAIGTSVSLQISERSAKTALSAASEAKASEHLVRTAAERALGNCCTVRPERTLTGDLMLHVVPAGSTVDLQPGVQLWHVYSGPEDITEVRRS